MVKIPFFSSFFALGVLHIDNNNKKTKFTEIIDNLRIFESVLETFFLQ